MLKLCTKCNTEKSLESFNKGTGKYNTSSFCKLCCKVYKREHYLKNKEKYFASAERSKVNNPSRKQEYDRQRRLNKLEEIRAYDKYRYQRDKDKRNLLSKKWVENNTDNRRAIARRWIKNNPEYSSIQSNIRHRRLAQATPKWLTEEQIKYMEHLSLSAKSLSKETGIEHQVDHIHPIRNKLFCGLNVPWNLQILTKEQNMKKGNKLK